MVVVWWCGGGVMVVVVIKGRYANNVMRIKFFIIFIAFAIYFCCICGIILMCLLRGNIFL